MAVAVSGGAGTYALVGSVLYGGFRAAAWYIPFFFLICATLLLFRELKPLPLFLATVSVIPMTTAGFWLQLAGDPPRSAAAGMFLGRFGEGGSSFVLFLVLLIEIVGIYLLGLMFFNSGRTPEKRDKVLVPALPMPAPDPAPQRGTTIEEAEDDSWWEEFEKRKNLQEIDAEPVDLEFSLYRREHDRHVASVPEDDEPLLEPADELTDELEDELEDEVEDVWGEEPAAPETEKVLIEEIEELEDEEEEQEEIPVPAVAVALARKIESYTLPRENLLDEYPDSKYWVIDDVTRHAAEVLKDTLNEFKIKAEVTGIRKGPVITMFEILPAPGVKLSKIVNLADNIALRLAASRVRIVAPIPGKHAVGIEVPNRKRAIVSFKEMIEDENFEAEGKEIPVILGKDITGETQIVDLVQTPHLLIAGATGSGKSVCVNSIICSILYRRSPEEVNLILIDPKIVELKLYNGIPHLLTPVITEPKKAFQALQYCLYEMERRYALLDALGVRDIRSYNRKVKKRRLATRPIPYLVVVIDEFADLMATTGKELESTLARLAAMSRAVGIHLVLATQRPSIDVITGLIKANIPSRIAFMVAGKFDSRIIIDAVGAEKLLGRGDMLFTSAWDPVPTRIQGAFLSEEEVERVAEYVRTLGEPEYIDDEIFIDDEDSDTLFDSGGIDDPLMSKALEVVTSAGKASASYLQRRLKIGYNRAARLVEEMEDRGIVGPQNGSKPREIIHIPDRYREERDGGDEE
jgi:S-DNA-T family DNA segregation ATPase FtsK/SpoIIIE